MKKEPGRLRVALAVLLEAEGFALPRGPSGLYPVSGYWKGQDVYRWECYSAKYEGRDVALGSWSTMTECVRHGIIVGPDDGYSMFEIDADGPA